LDPPLERHPAAEDETAPMLPSSYSLKQEWTSCPTATFEMAQYMTFTDRALRRVVGQELMNFVEVKKRMRSKS
jgi:hypothetical protein